MAEDLNRHFSKKDILISNRKKKKKLNRYVLGNPGAKNLLSSTSYSGLILGQRTNTHMPGGNKAHAPQLEKVCMLSVCCNKKHNQAQQSRFKTQNSQN